MTVTRRRLIGGTAATGTLLAAPAVLGAARPKVVVIGGGCGGATAARYLAQDSEGAIDVTLIEPQRRYHTCFFSNLAIGGFWDFDKTDHSYVTLATDYGINVLHDVALGIDRAARTVTTAGSAVFDYDRLVVSPGIDFVEGSVEGWSLADQDVMPHAYKGGTQARLLRAQIEAMPEGGTYVTVAPPNPYRCPPGPYERVSMVAHLLTQTNPTAKIIVADPKPSFSKMALFSEGWEYHYPGMIEWLGPDFGGDLVSVNPREMTVDIDGELVQADACNVIPAMKAGWIAAAAGLTDDTGWAPVNSADMSSRMDANVYVLGDSCQQGDMPKSGFSANSQARVCAMAIRAALTGTQMSPAMYHNTCWSLIGPDDAVKVGATYQATAEKIAKVEGFVSQTGEDAALRKRTFEESIGWYDSITADMFG
ncbi:MAG: NAD(P)/FAD-dependent oxidoreductase [Pseudomonadota bacterium]